MHEVLLPGLKALKEDLKKKIEELEDEREGKKKESIFYSSLTKRIDYRYESIEDIDKEIKLQERAIERVKGGKEKIKL